MERTIAMTRTLATLALAAVLVACGDESTGPGTNDAAAGTYVLQSANGEALPAVAVTWEDESGTWQARIQSGTLTLGKDGKYEAGFRVDLLVDGTVSLADMPFTYQGTYTISGTRITLHAADPTHGSTEGTLDGDVLTVSQPIEDHGTFTATYHRE